MHICGLSITLLFLFFTPAPPSRLQTVVSNCTLLKWSSNTKSSYLWSQVT
jgi:hypothetical protein